MIFWFELSGFLFITILGTLYHFIYEWSNHHRLMAILCAVNESTWEHVKMVIGPAIVWSLIEIPFIGWEPNFWIAKSVSMITMFFVMVIVFYTYYLILKKEILILGILDFVFSVICGQFISYRMLLSSPYKPEIKTLGLGLFFIIVAMYLTLTLKAPKSFLFRDPVNKKFGLDAHEHHNKKDI